jgi:iron(III) transport system substrate-binding protein
MTTSALRRVAALVAALLAVTASGCAGGSGRDTSASLGASWNEIVDKAKSEGQVTIYSGQGSEQLDEVKARFEQRYPEIKVNVVRAPDSELSPKVDAESKTGRGIADLFVTTSLPWLHANAATLSEPKGPDFDSPLYNRGENVAPEGFFVVDATILTFGWNTAQYPKGIRDFNDLLDPALAGGKLGVRKPTSAADLDFYRFLQDRYGDDYLTKLAAQKPRMYTSALPMAQALTSGEIAAGNYVQPLVDEMAAGAPVDWGLVDQPWGAHFYGALVKSAPHPNAAQVLANFLITTEGQTAIARKAASVLPQIEGTVGNTSDVRRPDLDAISDANLRDFFNEWDRLFGT